MAVDDYVRRAEAVGNVPKRQRLVIYYSSDEDNEGSNTSIAQEEYVDEHVSEEAAEEGEGEESEDDIGLRMDTNNIEDVTMEIESGELVSSSSNCKSVKLETSDIFDCPTCCQPLKSPIYQCNNGHVACSSCCTKLFKRCSFCRSEIGDIRCRAMEKVIEPTIVPCPNSIYGCKQTTTYGELSHEKTCIFMRCSCPSPNCNYIGSYSDLKRHSRDAHRWYKNNYNY